MSLICISGGKVTGQKTSHRIPSWSWAPIFSTGYERFGVSSVRGRESDQTLDLLTDCSRVNRRNDQVWATRARSGTFVELPRAWAGATWKPD